MSNTFNEFSNQIQDLVTAVKDLKDENKKIKEQNLKLENKLLIVNKRINILEQEQLGKHVEIIGVSTYTRKWKLWKNSRNYYINTGCSSIYSKCISCEIQNCEQ